MEIICAECGCLVDRGIRLHVCGDATCCCTELAIETGISFATRITSALELGDLDTFGRFLSLDALWGAPEQSVPTCQNREQILAWYENARTTGIRASVIETVVLDDHILVGLEVTGPTPSNDGDGPRERWQVLTYDNGQITSICGYPTRDTAESAVASPPSWEPVHP